MTRHSDHPLLRRELSCQLCGAYKGGGKIVCNECHVDIESGSSSWVGEVNYRLEAAELQLEMNEALGIW